MRHRVVWPFAAALLLAGCAVSSVPGRSGVGGTTPLVVDDSSMPGFRQEMTLIAAQYEADLSWNDPGHVSQDVANCYKNKGGPGHPGQLPDAADSVVPCPGLRGV